MPGRKSCWGSEPQDLWEWMAENEVCIHSQSLFDLDINCIIYQKNHLDDFIKCMLY